MFSLIKKVKKISELTEKRRKKVVIKVWNRSLFILNDFVGLKFKVHQGHKFINILITEEMVGFRFGEFAPTRVRHEYKKKRMKGK
jgi:small subunit ribosomal protein S19